MVGCSIPTQRALREQGREEDVAPPSQQLGGVNLFEYIYINHFFFSFISSPLMQGFRLFVVMTSDAVGNGDGFVLVVIVAVVMKDNDGVSQLQKPIWPEAFGMHFATIQKQKTVAFEWLYSPLSGRYVLSHQHRGDDDLST